MYKLFDCSDNNWDTVLKEMPFNMQDIYFTSDYYKMHEKNGDGRGKLFYYSDTKGNVALYPFLINKIHGYSLEKDYFDIETAYGYGGPISNCIDERFMEEFEKSFLEFCKANNIIAEFIRFHPFLRNETIFKNNMDVTYNRHTVYLDLSKGIDRIWNEDIRSKNRNVIRKSKKNGLFVEIGTNYENFKEIYRITMDKVEANNFFYFSDTYFYDLKDNDHCFLFNTKRENKVVAAAIFMGYGEYFHYHLAGSLQEELIYSPNNLMLWESIIYAIDNGFKYMHFGGGLTDNSQDSLLKFKSSFSKNYKDFYIGKRIHNNEIYAYLINEWEKTNNKKANTLLQYRI